ncbi:6-phosphogluconolactonase [Terfezia boudieri ATCC MYA-4762]|uniref:6-phosphogluconolactonase n=1 Tax=Terfezia boudieri ATCC MYA-4762 TaxID=1051890 RepID=A0A3N4LJY3_9PEZI|nr:6-phosphogluconolactonase [Terfezia boudieri ATCC MYA-4762]
MANKLPRVFSYPKVDTLSSSIGTYILRLQDTALQRHGHPKFRVAISGGSLLDVLVRDPKALLLNPNTKWPQWEIFFADERAVPLDHSDSNYLQLKRTILDRIPSGYRHGKPTVYPIDDTLLEAGDERGVTQEIADAYEQTLVRCFAAKDSVKVPVFDLILLGVGPDGHTAALFPGHELLREDSAWVAAMEDAPKLPPRRITLTLPVLTHANHVVFVATGEGKRDVLKKVFEVPEEGLPCSWVNRQAGGDRVAWFVDDKAIEGVQGFVKGVL